MPDIEEIQREHNRSMDALIASFRFNLDRIVTRAQAKIAGYLQANLSITDGIIDRTPLNNRVLRRLDTMFEEALNDAGYDSLVQAFVREFPGQLPFLYDTLRYLNENLKLPVPTATEATAVETINIVARGIQAAPIPKVTLTENVSAGESKVLGEKADMSATAKTAKTPDATRGNAQTGATAPPVQAVNKPSALTNFKLQAADTKALASFQLNAVTSLETVVQGVAGTAMRSAMFGVGGLKFADLVEVVAEKFATTVPNAVSLADTAMATFYREATDRAFRVIEADLPQMQIKYKYTSGPDDKKTRAFCHHLIQLAKHYTRAEIDLLDNHQFPVGSVFTTAGGWNCRHQWLLAVN